MAWRGLRRTPEQISLLPWFAEASVHEASIFIDGATLRLLMPFEMLHLHARGDRELAAPSIVSAAASNIVRSNTQPRAQTE